MVIHQGNDVLPMNKCGLTMKNCDLANKHGGLPMKKCGLTIKNVDLVEFTGDQLWSSNMAS